MFLVVVKTQLLIALVKFQWFIILVETPVPTVVVKTPRFIVHCAKLDDKVLAPCDGLP